jgi:hypothetical protein
MLVNIKKMNQFIPHDVFMKIKQAQESTLTKIKCEVTAEISHISQKFVSELQQNLENLIADPFNIYLKIPRNGNNHSKIYLEELKKSYFNSFHHEMQLVNGFFYVLLKHNQLTSNGDPRPKQMISEVAPVPVDDDFVFNDAEKKKFEDVLQKKTTLVPLFLQRRNSRLSLPSFSARRQADPVSVSDNPEETEA